MAREWYVRPGFRLVEARLSAGFGSFVSRTLELPSDFAFQWICDAKYFRSGTLWRGSASAFNREEEGLSWRKRVKLGADRWRHPIGPERRSWPRCATWEDIRLEFPPWLPYDTETALDWKFRFCEQLEWECDQSSWVAVCLDRWGVPNL